MTLRDAPGAASAATAAAPLEHRGRFPVTSNHGPFVLGFLDGTASADTLLSTKWGWCERASVPPTDTQTLQTEREDRQTLHQCLVCVRLTSKISSSLASVATETVLAAENLRTRVTTRLLLLLLGCKMEFASVSQLEALSCLGQFFKSLFYLDKIFAG
jgi:hypothetical protein